MRFHQALNPNQRLHLRVQSVAHKLEFTIWGDEADCAVILKPRKTNALVKLDILHFHGLSSRRATRGLKHNLIVQPQAKLRHSTQVALHLNGAQDLRSQNVPGGGYKEIEGFDDIEEDFILAVADSFASPGDGVGDGDWGAGLDFEFVRFLRDVPIRSAVLSFFPPYLCWSYSCNILLSVVCG